MATLFQCAMAIDTARALYEGHAQFYGIGYMPWESLSARAKHLWVERAVDAFEMVGPTRTGLPALSPKRDAYALLKEYETHGAVVAAISPDWPYGVTRDEVTE